MPDLTEKRGQDMTESKAKKPWTTPRLKRLEVTDEILNLFAENARSAASMPAKRVK